MKWWHIAVHWEEDGIEDVETWVYALSGAEAVIVALHRFGDRAALHMIHVSPPCDQPTYKTK